MGVVVESTRGSFILGMLFNAGWLTWPVAQGTWRSARRTTVCDYSSIPCDCSDVDMEMALTQASGDGFHLAIEMTD